MTESDPQIVAVAAHRPRELSEPLSHVDNVREVVQIDTSAGFIQRNVETVSKTRRAIVDHDPDALLFDCREAMGVLVALVCLWYGIPAVFRFKGNHWRGLAASYRPERGDGIVQLVQYYLGYFCNEVTYAIACGYIVVSEELKSIVLQRTGVSPEQVEVVHVPLEAERAAGTAESARTALDIDQEIVLVTVTNLKYEGKLAGVKTTVQGVQPVLSAHEDVAYVVAGGGTYQKDVEAFVKQTVTEPDVRDRIYTPGFIEDIADLYALADVFIYLSHIDGYPNVVLEAQEAGLPVVANSAFGMVEQITHEETGFLIDSTTPAAVEQTAQQLLEDDDKRQRVGQAARQRALTENNPAVIGQQLKEAVTRVTSSPTVNGGDSHDSRNTKTGWD